MPQFNYTVPPPIAAINQGNTNLCWLAATAVLFSWKDGQPRSMQEAANRLGIEFVAKYASGSALQYSELALWRSRAQFGSEHQQCIGAAGWDALLRSHGPLITVIDGTGSNTINHAVVVYGINGDGGTTTTRLKVANGNGGVLETYTLHDFVSLFEIGAGHDQLFSVAFNT